MNETYDDASDFMKQNKNLVKGISDTVRNEIIEVLLTKVLVDIAILVGTTRTEIEKENHYQIGLKMLIKPIIVSTIIT